MATEKPPSPHPYRSRAYATALNSASASIPRPPHSAHAMVFPGQLIWCVPCGQQCPFDADHLEQSKTLPPPWQREQIIFLDAIPTLPKPKIRCPQMLPRPVSNRDCCAFKRRGLT